MRSMCGADAGCLAMTYPSLWQVASLHDMAGLVPVLKALAARHLNPRVLISTPAQEGPALPVSRGLNPRVFLALNPCVFPGFRNMRWTLKLRTRYFFSSLLSSKVLKGP